MGATLFFLLVFLAAYCIDEWHWTRRTAAWGIGAAIFVVSVPSALATGLLADGSIAALAGASPGTGLTGGISILNLNWFDLVTHVVSDYMLPAGGLSMAVFVGWSWSTRLSRATVEEGRPGFRLFGAWIQLLRWVVPLVVGQVLVLGVLGEFSPLQYPRLARWTQAAQPWFVAVAIAVAAVALFAGFRGHRGKPTKGPPER